MTSRRLLQVALTVTGLVFVFGLLLLNRVWPAGWHWEPEQPTYLHMILGIYVTLGVFLLIAARAPERNVSLIWFTVWSSIVHLGILTLRLHT